MAPAPATAWYWSAVDRRDAVAAPARPRAGAAPAPPAWGRAPSWPSARPARCPRPPPDSSALNFCCRVSPASSPPSSVEALGLGLDLVDLLAMRSKVSKALRVGQAAHGVLDRLLRLGALLPRDEDVLLALGLLDLVVERAQLRPSASRPRPSAAATACSNSAGMLVVLLSCGAAPPWRGRRRRRAPPASPCAPTPCASSTCSSHCFFRRFSSAIETATCFFASTSWFCMSTTIWFSIFSGSSALQMRSFRFDLMSVPSREKIPMRFLARVVREPRSLGAAAAAARCVFQRESSGSAARWPATRRR